MGFDFFDKALKVAEADPRLGVFRLSGSERYRGNQEKQEEGDGFVHFLGRRKERPQPNWIDPENVGTRWSQDVD